MLCFTSSKIDRRSKTDSTPPREKPITATQYKDPQDYCRRGGRRKEGRKEERKNGRRGTLSSIQPQKMDTRPEEAAAIDNTNDSSAGGGLLAGIFNSSSSSSSNNTNNGTVTTSLSQSSSSSLFWIRSPHEQDEEQTSTNSNNNNISSYKKVLWNNPQYRSYVASHICMHTGDWFVRIANLIAVERLAAASEDASGTSSSNAGKAISYLVLCRLIPHLGFAQVGGLLADRYDRRRLMIGLDLCAGGVVLLYPLVALRYNSLPMLYGITALRATISAMYYPITTAIVPLLVQNEPSAMKFALTINAIVWSVTAILGGLLAGVVASTKTIGLEGCYYIDFATFWLSAIIMYQWTSGNYRVLRRHSNNNNNNNSDAATNTNTDSRNTNLVTRCCYSSYMTFRDLFLYLFTCGFGIMVFTRASGSLVWGMEDIINAEFATVYNEEDGRDGTEEQLEEAESAMRMGQLYSVMGGGCLVGPILSNLITNSYFPHTYQLACLVGLACITLGWLITTFVNKGNFVIILIGTFVRTMGSGTVWMNSTLILQTLSVPTFLGRIIAVDYMLTTLMEAASAGIAGLFSSKSSIGFDGQKLSIFGVILGSIMFVLWSVLYYFRIGAANVRFNQIRTGGTAPKTDAITDIHNINNHNANNDDDDGDDSDRLEKASMIKASTELSQDC